MKTRRQLVWILVLGLLVFNLVRGAVSLHLVPLNDFIEYWAAARVFMDGGNPYSATELLPVQHSLGWVVSEPLMMWNPPWTLPLVLPLALLPFGFSRGAWFLVNLALLFTCSDLLWRCYGGSDEKRWVAWLAGLLFLPDVTALYLGQISPLILAGVAYFLLFLRHRRPWIAGASLVLLTIKPHLLYLFWIFLLIWVIRERQWRVAAGFLAAMLTLCLGVVAVNNGIIAEYLHAVGSDQGPLKWQTPTLGTALRLTNATPMMQFVPAFCGFVAAAWLLWRWKARFDWRERLSEIVLLSVVTTSFSWTFDWVLLLPVLILMLVWFVDNPGRNWWLLSGLVLIQSLLLIQFTVISNYYYTLWVPPAVAILYAVGRRALCKGGLGPAPPGPPTTGGIFFESGM